MYLINIDDFCTFPSFPPSKAKRIIPKKTGAHLQQVITEDFCFLCSVKQTNQKIIRYMHNVHTKHLHLHLTHAYIQSNVEYIQAL